MTADIQLTQNMEMGDMKMSVTGNGTIESVTKGDKTLVRMELKAVRKMGEEGPPMDMALVNIMDEDYSYLLVTQMGQQMAVKEDLDPSKSTNPEALFAYLEKEHELKLQDDAEVDGVKCTIIDVIPKEPDPTGMAPTKNTTTSTRNRAQCSSTRCTSSRTRS